MTEQKIFFLGQIFSFSMARLIVAFAILYQSVYVFCAVSLNVLPNDGGFCNEIYTERFQTTCTLCSKNSRIECPGNATKLTSDRGHANCKFSLNMGNETHPRSIKLTGCSHICSKKTIARKCCDNYYGDNCDACPTYRSKICNGRGSCNDTMSGDGQCTCQGNFTGYACEQCAIDNIYGENCDQICNCTNGKCDSGSRGSGKCECFSGWKGDRCDKPIAKCENKTCGENSRCIEVHGAVICSCSLGFERDVNATNHTCIPINACEKSNNCHVNASCLSTGPNKYNCTCNTGFHGDGLVCDPIDPCRTLYGGCNFTTSICRYTSPGQNECECKKGYEMSENQTCELVDLCLTNSSYCDKNADCRMAGPLYFQCVCRDGYAGDGTICFNNLFGLIEDIHKNDPDLEAKMTWSIRLVKEIYHTQFRYHGPFTVFLPTDFGFRTITRRGETIDEFLADRDRASQILRQHIIIGKWTIDDLRKTNTFYTLQGKEAEIQTKNRGEITYRFRLSGSRTKSTIAKSDLMASNGIIHVVQKLLTNEADIKGDTTKTISKLIKKEGQFNRLESLIAKAGLENEFDRDDITVFASRNNAWDGLPDGVLEYLQTDKGIDKLRRILRHQILENKTEVAELINMRRVRSLANTDIVISVQNQGQIQLDGVVNITQTDIPAKNGLYYHVDGVLLPMEVNSILPGVCDYQNDTTEVQGYCRPWFIDGTCPKDTDTPTDKIERCTYYRPWFKTEGSSDSLHIKGRRGQRRICNRTVAVPICCAGYYGPGCSLCPGGFENSCSGHGKCVDGVDGNGTCICDEGFTGPACDTCSDPKKFGENCSSACTCLHGYCNNGIAGDGKCKRCLPPKMWRPHTFRGENCDKMLKPCNFRFFAKLCHVHSSCIIPLDNGNRAYKCVCDSGYEGDGATSCTPIDPCSKPHRGNCHKQAECKMDGPGSNICACREGWSGDGTYCYPGTMCGKQEHCHKDATCKKDPSHNTSLCWCNDGFYGNGTYCVPEDICLYNNGGCHSKASCLPTVPGKSNCTCNFGYSGDGLTCIPSIHELILNHPNLTKLASLIRVAGNDSLLLYEMDFYTFFAPTDDAIGFMMKRRPPKFWEDVDNVIDFINYHTILGDERVEKLKAEINVINRYETLSDGFYLHVSVQNESVFLSSNNMFNVRSKIVKSNLVGANGYVHIIDRALEPDYEDDGLPFLDELLGDPEFTIFSKWLKKRGMLDTLMDMNQYTLFVPGNSESMESFPEHLVTSNFLRYYILPTIRLSVSFDDGEEVDTLLGKKNRLQFKIIGNKVFVNKKEMITQADMLTAGGVVHKINGMLHPVLHKCDVVNKTFIDSPCISCTHGLFTCPTGYKTEPISTLSPGCMYFVSGPGFLFRGCSGLCSQQETIKGCCSGFYGSDCEKSCPGGSEFPCNNNGVCDDGLDGNGTCTCYPGFMGTSCEMCINSDNITSECGRTCAFGNGGCHINATCDEYAGNVTCTCPEGQVGDGHRCVRPCQEQNGGCHALAICEEKSDNDTDVSCICKSGYDGDGISCVLSLKSKEKSSSSVGVVVAGLLGSIFCIGILFVVVIVVRRRSNSTGIFKLIKRQISGSNESIEKLNPRESVTEDSIPLQPSPPAEVKFDNPLYSIKDQFSDTS